MGRYLEMVKRAGWRDVVSPFRTVPVSATKATEATKAPLPSFRSNTTCSPETGVLVVTGDDGRRVWIRAMGGLLGWPRLTLDRADAIAAGEAAWRQFTAAPANDQLFDRAVKVLLAIDTEGNHTHSDTDDSRLDSNGNAS